MKNLRKYSDWTVSSVRCTSGKVAIIVPVYNAGIYLKKCLDSILRQKYEEIVLIVVNDGSNDCTCEILSEYQKTDNRILIINQMNKGLPFARNAGLAAAEKIGDIKYIAFVDADDFVDEDFIGIHIENLVKHRADVSVCGYFIFNNDGKLNNAERGGESILTQQDYLQMVFRYRKWKTINGAGGSVWKQVYKLSVIRGIRFPEDRELVEDEAFCVKVSKLAKRYVYIHQNLYYYRLTTGSLAKQEKFLRRLMDGRKLCWALSDGLPRDLRLLIFCSYLKVRLDLIKKGEIINDLRLYTGLVAESCGRGIIDFRTLKRFLLLCFIPGLAGRMCIGRNEK